MSQLFGIDSILSSLTGNYESKTNTTSKSASKNMIGNPTLSEKASSYYEELKAKYSDVEFVLVSEDQKANAKETAANINSDKSMIVLISEEEVEKMATDETVRKQNEQLITDAKAQMPDLLAQLKNSGTNVKSFGIEIDDNGNASYFAVVDKSIQAQKDRIESNLEEKRAEKKADAKEDKNDKLSDKQVGRKEELTTITASSMEELIKKIQTNAYESLADYVMTPQEKMIGQGFDLSI